MQAQMLSRVAACVLLASSISTACANGSSSDHNGTGGVTATGGTTAPGTGGTTTAGTGGTTATGTGGTTTIGTGGISGTGTGGRTTTGTGGQTSTGTGGTMTTGAGGTSTGGATAGTGGRTTGSGGAGGAATGGSAGGAPGAGGSGTGGTPTGGQGVPGNYPLGNPPVKSAGCGNMQGVATVTAGGTAVASGLATSKRVKITSGGQSREFIIDIPADYDPTKPYRLFLTFHWIGSTDTAVATGSVTNGGATNWGFYGLHRMATGASAPAIFIAPQALPNSGGTWSTSSPSDQMYVDDILNQVLPNLCIDTSRVFITGFSFGGMMTYSMSTTHQKVFRAAVGIAPANYNIYLPNPIPHDPIAWMSTTGMSDGTCPYDAGNGRGAKYIALGRGADNGCTVPATIPTWTSSSPTRHVCYDFQGCKSNYPVKTCTFNGVHQAAPYDSGSGDNGLTSWIPTESWNFFTQF